MKNVFIKLFPISFIIIIIHYVGGQETKVYSDMLGLYLGPHPPQGQITYSAQDVNPQQAD